MPPHVGGFCDSDHLCIASPRFPYLSDAALPTCCLQTLEHRALETDKQHQQLRKEVEDRYSK